MDPIDPSDPVDPSDPSDPSEEPVEDSRLQNLRALSVSSAIRLAVREGGGIVIRLVGVVIVTRLIGPGKYGIYAGCSVFILF